MNICGTTNDQDCATRSGSICQKDSSSGSTFMLGSWDLSPEPAWALIDPNDNSKGIRLTYTNGDPCVNTRVVNINFLCASSTGKTFTIAESQTTQCQYDANFHTPLACLGDGLSGAWIFTIIVLVTFSIYLIGGCALKYRTVGKIGADTCPNLSFWKELPALVKDGCSYFYNFSKQLDILPF